MIRIDMSEYMEKHAVSRLVGSPPGYIGYDEGGQLTEAVRRKPYSVLLLDEIEKAHPDVFNILLQILEDGRLTDAQGRTVDFRHCIVIMTSNIGASEIARNTPLGFAVSDDETGITYDDMKNRIMGELKKVFRPEFLNRIDEVIVFHKLAKDEIKEIVELLLRRIRESMAERELQLELSEAAKDLLVEKGWDPAMGARPLRRAIQRYIEDPLADFVLRSQVPSGSTVLVEPGDDGHRRRRRQAVGDRARAQADPGRGRRRRRLGRGRRARRPPSPTPTRPTDASELRSPERRSGAAELTRRRGARSATNLCQFRAGGRCRRGQAVGSTACPARPPSTSAPPCGHETARWAGRCPGCGEWNTLVEQVRRRAGARRAGAAGRRGRRPARRGHADRARRRRGASTTSASAPGSASSTTCSAAASCPARWC